jgi:hypothetical protein
MNRFLVVIILLFLVSCNTDQPNVIVSGQVAGLKKGTLYLERLNDTSLVVLDSMIVNGEPEFLLTTHLDEPDLLYLSLNANSDNVPRISFFTDSGTVTIRTTLKRFFHDAKIEGSEHQIIVDEYKNMITQFNNKNLELIKAGLEVSSDSIKLDSIKNLSDNLLKRKYLFTINFAKNNRESEVAPYLLLSEVYDANVTYLDTVYKVFPEHIANSKYGKKLANFIEERKKDSIK